MKAISESISVEFTSIINFCLAKDYFPISWKNADVVIINNGLDKDPLNNKSYQPISLLSVMGKILEQIICTDILRTITPSMSANQHGFIEGRSTITAMNSFNHWTDTKNEKHVVAVLLDISGEFNNIRWTSLLEDLKPLGFRENILRIIISYLPNRTASYSVGSTKHKVTLTRGCPQGSKLGPRL